MKEQTLKRDGTLTVKPKELVIVLLALAILAVFLNNKLSTVLGPLMAVAFTYLYLFGYPELVTAMIIVANDDLGTIVGGSLSFPYLLLGLVVLRFLIIKNFQGAGVAYFAAALVLILQPFFVKSVNFRIAVYSFTFISALLILPRNEESLQRLIRGIALTVVLIGIHAVITGGVEFYEQSKYSEQVLRKGILGVGIGDANFSCYLLLIGTLCIWYAKNVSRIWKIVCTCILLNAMTITLSVTGLLGLLLISLLAALLGKEKSKSLIAFFAIAITVVCLLQVYIELPASWHNETLDGYILRVEEKLFQAQAGNYEAATTERSYLANLYINYIFNQSFLPMLFGGNKVIAVGSAVAHNTYLTLMVQVGILGAGAIFVWAIWKLLQRYRQPVGTENRSLVLILKALSLFFGFSLSIFYGSTWALWWYFLIVL